MGWTIAFARLTVAVFFLLFGEYKLVGASSHAWASVEFPKYLHGYVAGGEAAGGYRMSLENVVVPHAPLWAYVVGAGEAATGVALALGVAVRAASTRYFGAELDHLALCLLFAILAVSASVDPFRLERRYASQRRAR
ncbi:MAG: hypothetical protein ABR591_06950 [Candidatus Velthaea sp.]